MWHKKYHHHMQPTTLLVHLASKSVMEKIGNKFAPIHVFHFIQLLLHKFQNRDVRTYTIRRTSKKGQTCLNTTTKQLMTRMKRKGIRFSKIGKHLLLGRSDVVAAKTDDTKYISNFILKVSPWEFICFSEIASAVFFGMASSPGNKRGNSSSSMLLSTSYETLIGPHRTPNVQKTDSSSKGILPWPGITNSLDSGPYNSTSQSHTLFTRFVHRTSIIHWIPISPAATF